MIEGAQVAFVMERDEALVHIPLGYEVVICGLQGKVT